MISIVVVAALAMLVLITQAGAFVFGRVYPQGGTSLAVTGARLNVVDLGPREAKGPPIVLIHGASCNLEAMRLPFGDLLARKHLVIRVNLSALARMQPFF